MVANTSSSMGVSVVLNKALVGRVTMGGSMEVEDLEVLEVQVDSEDTKGVGAVLEGTRQEEAGLVAQADIMAELAGSAGITVEEEEDQEGIKAEVVGDLEGLEDGKGAFYVV